MNTVKNIMKKSFLVILICIGIWIAGDFIYSRVVGYMYQSWEETTLRDTSGVREGCHAYTTGMGSVAVLMIHGFADSPAVFNDMASQLAKEGFTCRAMRLPGHCVPVDQADDYDEHDWIRGIQDEFNILAVTHSNVWVIAHSMGGALAVEAVAEEMIKPDGLVLIAPLIQVSNRRSPILSSRTWFELSDDILLFTDLFNVLFPVDAHDPVARAYDLDDRFVPRSTYEALFSSIDMIQDDAPDIHVPLMMILTPHDRVIDVEAAQRFFDQVGSDDKKLMMVEQSGHAIPLDCDWEKVTDEIGTFINKENP